MRYLIPFMCLFIPSVLLASDGILDPMLGTNQVARGKFVQVQSQLMGIIASNETATLESIGMVDGKNVSGTNSVTFTYIIPSQAMHNRLIPYFTGQLLVNILKDFPELTLVFWTEWKKPERDELDCYTVSSTGIVHTVTGGGP